MKYRLVDKQSNIEQYRSTKGLDAVVMSAGVISVYFVLAFAWEAIDNNVILLILSVLPAVLAFVFVLNRSKKKKILNR